MADNGVDTTSRSPQKRGRDAEDDDEGRVRDRQIDVDGN